MKNKKPGLKYTIEGYSQKILLDWELDCIDAVIINYVSGIISSDNVKKIEIDGKFFYWIIYDTLIERIPIINIKSKSQLRKRFIKYEDCGLIEHYHKIDKDGSFSYYRLTNEYNKLV